jgi:ribonuclease VapC
MFLDASAIIAIVAQEDDAANLAARLDQAVEVHTSPITIFESALGLARIGNVVPSAVMPVLERFLTEAGAVTMAIDVELGHAAIDAFERFGKGRPLGKTGTARRGYQAPGRLLPGMTWRGKRADPVISPRNP